MSPTPTSRRSRSMAGTSAPAQDETILDVARENKIFIPGSANWKGFRRWAPAGCAWWR